MLGRPRDTRVTGKYLLGTRFDTVTGAQNARAR
jgi:hypothetical protein